MNIPDMVAVMLAAEKGAQIEYKSQNPDDDKWEIISDPNWNWNLFYYRVKREPLVQYLVVTKRGTVANIWDSKKKAEDSAYRLNQTYPHNNPKYRAVKMVEEIES